MTTLSLGRKATAGTPHPQGATFDGAGVNFSVFSAHATRVELCLFDADGKTELTRIDLPDYTDEKWHGYVEGIGPGTVYGFRVHGPYEPENGHRFNPHKLLPDPYARASVGALTWNDACFGYTIGDERADLSFDARDSAPFVPKSVVTDPSFGEADRTNRPGVPWDDTVIYELHVGGYTRRRLDLAERLRGTLAGLGSPQIVSYIRSLGVTAVELMPVHLFVNDRHLLERGLTNFWGYNSLGFFQPDPRYLAEPRRGHREFKQMVAAFHDAGLEVILDVVYNHSAEGNELGPTLAFRGLDNRSYYRLVPENPRYYNNDAGTGNTLNLRHPRVTQLITDSLRFWAAEMQVDGFRFDLGTTLCRPEENFDEHSAFLTACIQDPVLSNVKLIAEPWDCGPGGYQVGGFPPGWAEWNDKFRDEVRDFWNWGTSAGRLSPRLCGSADLFDRRGRKPWASINFVTAHDGFTLNDVVSYERKHNEANGEGNADGGENNRSANYGVEGASDDPGIGQLRERQVRNLLTTLLSAQGTPMLLAGDEFGRTQQGNNNAYCQDNEISWVDWSLHDKNRGLVDFVRGLIAVRRGTTELRQTRFLHGEPVREPDVAPAMKDVLWVAPSGEEVIEEQWADPAFRAFGMLLGGATPVMVIFNPTEQAIEWLLPASVRTRSWRLRIDSGAGVIDPRDVPPMPPAFTVSGRSVIVLASSDILVPI
jgi:glycogen operon protein